MEELKEIGLTEVTMDDNGYVMATLPANTDKDVPVIDFSPFRYSNRLYREKRQTTNS